MNPWTMALKGKTLNAPGSVDLPGGVRDEQRAAAQALFKAMVKAVPLSVALPNPQQSQAQLLHRMATGYGQPTVHKGK